MSPNNDDFEVLPAGKMREKYGLYAGDRPEIKLDPKRVPPKLRHLIPLAEKWGVADDLIREDLVDKATKEERDELNRLVEEYDDLLDAWLAGPEAQAHEFSREYVAFSAMRMAADCF